MMTPFPADVQAAISTRGGRLAFGEWQAIDGWRDLPEVDGVYAIGLKLGVQYPKGHSRIIYLGSSVNLRKRISQQRTSSHSGHIERIKKRYTGGLIVCCLPLPLLSVEWRHAMEDAALQAFNATFGCYPVCNQDSIESIHAHQCSGLFDFQPCADLPYPLSLETLARQLGVSKLGRLRQRLPAEAYLSKTGVVQCPQTVPPQVDLWELASIYQDHVATWTVEKMRALIALCKPLTRRKGRTSVQTFEAPFREVPRPLTWGEVALIQARSIAGTWSADPKLWVKVVFGKELLGQAILDVWGFRAEDKSDLPQTDQRQSIARDEAWQKEIDSIEGELSNSFEPSHQPIAEVPECDDPNNAEHIALLRESHLLGLREAKWKADFERESLIERDKERKCRQHLMERIEAIYVAGSDN